MNITTAIALPLLIGVIAGLLAMTAPAAISLAARAARLDLTTTSLAFLGYACTPWPRRAVRARLAAAFGSDRPAAVVEDLIAIGGAFLIVTVLP
jgi:uncharacterized membrane protein